MESLFNRADQDTVIDEDATAIDFPFKPKSKKTHCDQITLSPIDNKSRQEKMKIRLKEIIQSTSLQYTQVIDGSKTARTLNCPMDIVSESVEPVQPNTEVMMVARKSRLNLIKEYQENI